MQATAANSRPAAVQPQPQRTVRLSVDLPGETYREVKATTLALGERLDRSVRTVHVIRALIDLMHSDRELRDRVETHLRQQSSNT
jgi:hypothetical protein